MVKYVSTSKRLLAAMLLALGLAAQAADKMPGMESEAACRTRFVCRLCTGRQPAGCYRARRARHVLPQRG